MAELKLVRPVETRSCDVCGKERPIGEWINRGTKRIKYAGCRKCRENAYTKARRKRINDGLRGSELPTLDMKRRVKRRAAMGEDQWRRYTRHHWLKSTHKITLEEYERMHREQNGVCAICRETDKRIHNRSGETFALAVDHDHVTGKIRGLLCGPCNQSLGGFRDSPLLLRAAAEYLEKRR